MPGGKGQKSCAIAGCFVVIVIVVFCTALSVSFLGGNGESTSEAGTINSVGGTNGGDLANADALTVAQIKTILKNQKNGRGKRLLPYAQQIYDAAHAFHINPLLALAIAEHDSAYATQGAGRTCNNPGNISYRSDKYKDSGITGIGRCDILGGPERWEGFSNVGDGIQAEIWLLRTNYLDKGCDTLEKIIAKYAPSSDNNNEARYVESIRDYMTLHAGGN